MEEVYRLENPLNYNFAIRRIRKLWNDGYTRFTIHVQKRMNERNIDTTDIQNMIRYGRVIDHSRPKEHWRYTVEGPILDRRKGKCVVEINGTLIIITVI